MNITREHVKEATGLVSSFGGGVLTSAFATRVIMSIPNPLLRVTAWVSTFGLGVTVGSAAKKGTDEIIDSVCTIVDEIKNR